MSRASLEARHEVEQELIWADERQRHENKECPGAPECAPCLDEEEKEKL